MLGWTSLVLDSTSNFPIAGGTNTDRLVARKIATAEYLERLLVSKIPKVEFKKFGLDLIPTTSGFACGFENQSTKRRALCEGIERWAFSQWIDEHRYIPSLSMSEVSISRIGRELGKSFTSATLYSKKITFDEGQPVYTLGETGPSVVTELLQNYYFRVFLGETSEGIFCGSKVVCDDSVEWEHEIVEAHRNYTNYNLFVDKPGLCDSDWYMRRVLFFGKNKNLAKTKIPIQINDWPVPKILLLEDVPTGIEEVYLWRCLLKDFLPWHVGPDDRFVI